MSVPYYVPPEQLIKDRSDFARAGVAKGRPAVAASCAEGIVLVTENSSRSLHKIGELYDRLAFAGVGRYSEFEALRVAGIRYVDLHGYAYDRSDVHARALAGAYASALAEAFTGQPKPLEVEIALAEVGATAGDDQIFRCSFDGFVSDDGTLAMIGGSPEQAAELRARHDPEAGCGEVLRLAVGALAGDGPVPAPAGLEAALLARGAERRSFRRLAASDLARWLA
jgi:proteasome alpha subunit